MEVFVVLPVVVLVMIFLVRRTKKKAASIDPPKARLERAKLENHDSVKQAMRSPEWKKRAKKARAKARQNEVEKNPVVSISASAAGRSTPPRRSSSRPVLQFCYQDASGQVTTREVSNFRVDGDYIKGYCHTRDATRTFRKDNIVEWISGRELLTGSCLTASPVFRDRSIGSFEIAFTGFGEVERKNLESMARDSGMVVRKSITKNLEFLCTGPRPSGTKVDEASTKGCTILSQEQFFYLIETGELPG
ncbi:hypothetical protein [Halomonas sp. BN3-1]|uniref:hypothetical protein n=1 Tax=Halomonas sp. BN3-1 TaxID=2082393 RepID=UPI0013B35C01|nr:hypothetical protein [Halomonas sp. BN3-1]